jgi:hypothetical protein
MYLHVGLLILFKTFRRFLAIATFHSKVFCKSAAGVSALQRLIFAQAVAGKSFACLINRQIVRVKA